MKGDPYVSMVVCSPPIVCATAMMNANAFSTALEDEVHSVSRRLAIFLHHVNAMSGELDRSRELFFVHLQRNWQAYVAAVKNRAEVEYVAFSDGIAYLSCLHAVMYEFKAFLDLFARLLCRLVSEGGPPGFNKGKVAGQELSGGRVINWLSQQRVEVLPNREALISLMHEASANWITLAVGIRDTLGHYRDLPGFRHMRLSVTYGPAVISSSDILAPEMPDGQDLAGYAQQLCNQLCTLVSSALLLLPNVKADLNEPWNTARRYLSD